MAIVQFTKAQRMGSKALIGLVAESGAGKTMSAILLARGLVGPQGRFAMLDTENGRGRMYAKLAGGYDYAELTPPFTPERYVESIQAAEDAGFDALILDSASHEWEGIGGVIEAADNGKAQNGDALKGLVKWAQPKARHKRFVQKLLTSKMHLIICIRAKEKLEQKGDKIVSAGFVPVQDKRFKYELTVQLFFPNEGDRGVPVVSLPLGKCPEDLLGAFPAGKKVTVETGAKIAEWVAGGVPIDHAYEALRLEAMEAAEGGRNVMRSFWERLDKPKRQQLAPLVPNLQSIADEADRDAAQQQTTQPAPTEFRPAEVTTTAATGGDLNDSLDGLFGDDTEKAAAE